MARSENPGLPSRKQILEFIESSDQPAGKREIAKAFGIKGQDKIPLKALLRDMADEGLIDLDERRAFHKMGGIPRVTVLRVTAIEGNEPVAIPERWEAEAGPPPKLRIKERGRRGALGVGDRILARTEERGKGHIAHVMKVLKPAAEELLGVLVEEDSKYWLQPVDRKQRHRVKVADHGKAQSGQLVRAEPSGHGARQTARVTEVLGDPFAPKAFSSIAIEKYGIPHEFSDETLREAERMAQKRLSPERREDLRDLPIVAIDPVDARDHDDAIWAAPDDDSKNQGGFKAIVAIADVSFYVRPGGALDKAALKRGNSVYFPDQVVPMLPERLSTDVCSLKAGEDKAAMICHLTIDAKGQIKTQRFARGLVRLAANIAYEDAQAAIDGKAVNPLTEIALKPLWDCWALLKKARDEREPLDLDLPEKRVMLDEDGKIVAIAERERLDAHRVVEDFMIAANVAAAKALEKQKSPLIYRVHETPAREKLVALKDYAASFDLGFALGQVITPAVFNRLIDRVGDEDIKPQIMEQVLRSQTQAYYGPDNLGHFGLALGSYAHFTSPIRRYADLIVHRALVRAYKMDPADSGLDEESAGRLDVIAENISQRERRAMVAERETVDRYIAAHLSEKVGEVLNCRITGVQDFGFFATVLELGGDGLVPVRTLGGEYFDYIDAEHALVGRDSGTRYALGQKIALRLIEANPFTGSLLFELPEGKGALPPRSANRPRGKGKYRTGKRGRPANIRHKGKRSRKA